MLLSKRLRRSLLVAVTVFASIGAVALAGPAQAAAIGTEPTLPYALPSDASLPRAGCATTVADPTAPPASSTPSLQVVYGWNDASGNHYEDLVQAAARIIDRIDWALDESSNYDQHIKLSCRSGYDTSTYAGYAHALVAPLKFTTANTSDWSSMVADVTNAGYDDANRWTIVLTDFATPSQTNPSCHTAGGAGCVGFVELWDAGVVGHELFHLFGAGHAYMTEANQQYNPDIMMNWGDYWAFDLGYRQNYDPSELTATFYVDGYPSTAKNNAAAHPLLTTPVCCDEGANNDLLTAQERTIEADAPGATPTGFTFSGSGWFYVTQAGSQSGASRVYFDNRRSLEASTYPQYTESSVSVTRRPAVTAGHQYKFFTRLRADSAGLAKLRLAWYSSSGTLLSTSDGSQFTLTSNWLEWSTTATAPANAATVKLSVVAPASTAQPNNLVFNVDTLQLNDCTADRNGTCRIST